MTAPVKVLYITSVSHSGSTLLDLILSSHSRVVSAGEIKTLSKNPDVQCTCGTLLRDCPFWQRVDEALDKAGQRGLADLDVYSPEPDQFCADNVALFQAVQQVTGATIIVDSSKDIRRLSRLLDCPGLDVQTLHLVRCPQGVVYSGVRKQRDWRTLMYGYLRRVIETRRLLIGRPHLDVRYERFVKSPRNVISRVLAVYDLAFETDQLDWTTAEHHNAGGNRMRFSSDSAIKVDHAWKTGLTAPQKRAISWRTLPTRVPGTWLYDRLTKYFDPETAAEKAVVRRKQKKAKRDLARRTPGTLSSQYRRLRSFGRRTLVRLGLWSS